LIAKLRRGLFAERGWPLGGLQLHAYFWTVWPGWYDRAGYLGQVLSRLPTRLVKLATPCDLDRAAVSLPDGMQLLYYPLRFIRLAVRYQTPRSLCRRLAEYF
jgi:hypothetical protein